ncbi:MAG TPA: hypothetical protein VF042_07885 [Gemmatimonadaceae bacterium]
MPAIHRHSIIVPLLFFAIACASSEPRDTSAQAPRTDSPQSAAAPANPQDFVGDWEAVSDDGTTIERAQMQLDNGTVHGVAQSLERGYFSGNVTKKAEAFFTGTPSNGGLDITVSDESSGQSVKGRAIRRGGYLILSIGEFETAYARPGKSLVQNAQGSKEAELLARSVTGMVYQSGTSASGRDGSFTGGRMRLALCSDGTAAFDKSDLATTGGSDAVDMGDAVSRRGKWSIVLYAGAPAIRAQWEGTGTSYSLTRYFRVEPHRNGSGARVDGVDLGVSGSC